MRMSSFIMGGILGAAAAVYFNRSSKPIMYSLSQAGASMNKVVDTARNMMKDKTVQSNNEQFSSNYDHNLENVEAILKQEPQTQHQVDEILQENGQRTFQ